jgi:predicted MFS family arabinose efflux permease
VALPVFAAGLSVAAIMLRAVTGRRVVFLALAAFVVASDATLVAALLRQIASTLSASPSAAGQAVTVYAAGYALGAPLIIRAARRARRERLIAGSLGVFAAANAATAAAPSLAALLGARIAAGACGGAFMAAAAATAAGSVAPSHRGRALAVIVGGSSAGTAFGVPLGTAAGGAVGWRPAFFGITAVTALTAAALACLSPQPGSRPASARTAIPRGTVLLTLATTLLWSTGSFTFFTYVGVVLHQTASVGAPGLAGFLLVFGLAGLAGAAAAGWLADKAGPLPALAAGLTLTALSLAGLGLIAAVAVGPAAVIDSGAAIAGYGFGTWAITPPQQHRLLSGGGNDRLLLSLNASALYAGVALGSAIGGLTLGFSHSTAAVCWTAAGIELAALALAGSRHPARFSGDGSQHGGNVGAGQGYPRYRGGVRRTMLMGRRPTGG